MQFQDSEHANTNGGRYFVHWAEANGINLDDREDWQAWFDCFCAGWDGCYFNGGPANLERIVQCVNACAGIEDPQGSIEKAREAIRNVTSDYLGVLDDVHMQQLEAALAALTPKQEGTET